MKKIKLTVLAACLVAGGLTVQAQTNNPQQTMMDRVFGTIGGITNFAVEPYITYADKAPTKIGGGVLGIWNVNAASDSLAKVGLGMGIDWLGQLSLISVNAQLSAPFHPIPSIAPSFILSPFVLAGVGTASSGGGNFNGSVSTIQDVGAYVSFGHALGGSFNAGFCYGQWTGVGAYDVKREHIFVGWSHGF